MDDPNVLIFEDLDDLFEEEELIEAVAREAVPETEQPSSAYEKNESETGDRFHTEDRTPVPVKKTVPPEAPSPGKKGAVPVMRRTRRKKKFPWKKVIPAVLIPAAVLAAASYGYGVYYYRDRFLPGTVAENVELSNLTETEAGQLLTVTKIPEDSVFSLSTLSGETVQLDTVPLFIRRRYKGIGEALKNQNEWTFLFAKNEIKELSFDYDVELKEENLDELLCALPVFAPENVVKHEDSYVYEDEKGSFSVMPAVDGNEIDPGILSDAVVHALYRKEKEISIEDTGAYIRAGVREDDPGLLMTAAVENSFEAINLSIDMGADCRVSVLPDDLRKMTAEGAASDSPSVLDEKALDAYVEKLSRTYGTKSASGYRYFRSITGKKPVVFTDYGWEMDKDATKAAITPMLDETLRLVLAGSIGCEDQGCEAKAVWITEAVSHGERDTGETWVEVDLSNQKMYFVENGELLLESDVVTGHAKMADRATPPGIFKISYKSLERDLVGYNPDGTESYRSHVHYWMPFNKNIGLHDATWRGSFGGDIYTWYGSHGCVNMPLAGAKELYQHVYKGMPVIVYK